MDRAHRQGVAEGFMGGPRDPGVPSGWTRFHGWAREAGNVEGRRKNEQLSADLAARFTMTREQAVAAVIRQTFERPNTTLESAGADDSPTTRSGPEAIAADEPSWPRFRLWGRR
jgi:hypothetical protein